MCTATDNDYEESVQCMEEKPSHNLVGALCKKCGNNKAEVVLRVKDTYCRQCFIDSFTHKFRATLGKSKMLKPNDKIILAISGSPSSLAMLQLVKDGIEITTPKRLQCIPCIVYVDEGAVLGHTYEQRQEICISMAKLTKKYGIPGFITSLDRCLDISSSHSKLCEELHESMVWHVNEERELRLQSLFAQLKSLSSKEDLLLKLRHKLLFSVAEELDCSKIFVGDCATDLAVSIMANLSLGRGAQLPYEVGFCDFRHGKTKLLRPMRDFMKKEIAFYMVFKNIGSVSYPKLSSKVDPFSSIQRLTEKFITELQKDFPSTVSTIFRTGDKLTSEGTRNVECKTCLLCETPLDTLKQDSSSMQATEFSQLISSPMFADVKDLLTHSSSDLHSNAISSMGDSNCCTSNYQCTCISQNHLQKLDFEQIKENLCYGCRLIVKEMDSLDFLPGDITSSAKTEIMQKQLRKEIQDFLL
ncbi:Cytoplasmic tRNA 2-thiolation protein 2 [Gryllus bimaculatus]|nr:Cytoplasmic tRNA 2-thiolation protein 2 [Gryllus bimaculatus]